MDENSADIQKIASNWKFVRTLGIVLIVGGLIGMLAPQFLTVAIIKVLGLLLLLGGLAQTASALQLRFRDDSRAAVRDLPDSEHPAGRNHPALLEESNRPQTVPLKEANVIGSLESFQVYSYIL